MFMNEKRKFYSNGLMIYLLLNITVWGVVAEDTSSHIIFSTFIGGEERDRGYSMAIDDDGYIYVTGYTRSVDFPITDGAFNDTLQEYRDVYVAKLSPDGSELIYSTYVGGSSYDEVAMGICVDDAGSVYVAGTTGSEDFPTTEGAYDRIHNGGEVDGFIFKLSPDGSTLEYSTFIGGKGIDVIRDIALDQHHNVTVTGSTNSTNFPTTTTAKDKSHNGLFDAFVLRLSDNGSKLMASTYLGGGKDDEGYAIALDGDSHAYVTGYTESANFPKTTGVLDNSHNGYYDVFVTKVSRSGTTYQYSTFIGGTGEDVGNDIVLDNENNAYVTGFTSSDEFPTTKGAYDRSINGWWENMFVLKLNPTGTNLGFSTFIGGEYEDYGMALDLDDDDNVYVVGQTSSDDFPTTPNAFSNDTAGNITLSVLKDNGTVITSSTAIGGKWMDDVYDIEYGGNGYCFITGSTPSDDFPTTRGAFNESLNGDEDVYVIKMRVPLNTPPTASIDSITPSAPSVGDTVYFNGSGSDPDGHITAYFWHSSIDGNLSTSANFSIATLTAGDHVITFRVADNLSFWSKNATYFLHVADRPTATIDDISPSPALYGQLVHFNGSGSDPDGTVLAYEWKSDLDGALSSSASFTDRPSVGNHTISFRVQDDDGLWSDWVTRTLQVLQPGAELPVASITSITPNPARQGATVTFSGNGSHSVWSVAQYAWLSDMQGLLSQNTTFSTSDLLAGTHTITFKVIDETGQASLPVNRTLVVLADETDDDDGMTQLGLDITIVAILILAACLASGAVIYLRTRAPPSTMATLRAPGPTFSPSHDPYRMSGPPTTTSSQPYPPPPPAPPPVSPVETVTLECPDCQHRIKVQKLGQTQTVKCGSCGLEGDIEV